MKEVYVAKDIPQGKTINDIIKQKKDDEEISENILSKTAFKTEFVDIVLPSLAKKSSKKIYNCYFNVFSCVCKEAKHIAIADFLSYAGDFKSSPKVEESDEDESEAEDMQSEEQNSSAKFAIVSNELKESFQKLMQSGKFTSSSIRKEFEKIDRKKSGQVKFKDFTKVVKKCLKNAKLDKVKDEDLSVVMDCFDIEESGMFAYEEFICYLEYLGESKVLRQLKSKLRAKLTTSKSLKPDENDSKDEIYENKRKALNHFKI